MRVSVSHSVLLFAFLLPVFVQRIFIGGSDESYSNYPHLPIDWLGYISNAFFLLICLINGVGGNLKLKTIGIIYVLTAVNLFHLILLVIVKEEGHWYPVLANARQTLWVVTCLIAAETIPKFQFVNGVIKITEFTIVVIFITRIAYELTGVPFQMIITNGVPRSQGFLSEPSTFGCLLAGYVAVAIDDRQRLKYILATMAALAANSAIAYGGIMVAVLTSFIYSKVFSVRMRMISGICIWISFWIIVVALVKNSIEISRAAVDLMARLEVTDFGSTVLYTGFMGRWLEAISQLRRSLRPK